MSNQGIEGWFPECLICGMGNVGPIVCLDPTCHEHSEGKVIVEPSENLEMDSSHWWKGCNLCDQRVRSDGGSWGT